MISPVATTTATAAAAEVSREGTFEVVASREPEQTESTDRHGVVNVGAKAGQVLKAV